MVDRPRRTAAAAGLLLLAGCATANHAGTSSELTAVGRITAATPVEGAIPVPHPDVFFDGRLYTFEPVLHPEAKVYFVDWNKTCPGNPPGDQVYLVLLERLKYVVAEREDTQPIKGNWSDVLQLKACVALDDKNSSGLPLKRN